MTKTYELIAESLNEIINDLEKNDGKNLKCESLSLIQKSINQSHQHNNLDKVNETFFVSNFNSFQRPLYFSRLFSTNSPY